MKSLRGLLIPFGSLFFFFLFKTKADERKRLIVLNVCSLVFAIIANLFLLFNFARKVRYAIAQPVTIILWYISFVFLIVPIALIHFLPLSSIPNTAYSQSFYYAFISSITYFSISTLLLFNFLGTKSWFGKKPHYPPSFRSLTHPQRTLMLQTISFSLYLSLGAGIFSAIQGWGFSDALYWADYTVLTIGLGSDFPLDKVGAEMVLIPYASFGILLLALVVTSVRGLVLERTEEKVLRRRLGKVRDRWMGMVNDYRNRGIVVHEGWWRRGNSLEGLERFTGRRLRMEESVGQWSRLEFQIMRYIEDRAEKAEKYIALSASFTVVLVIWTAGATTFWLLEASPSFFIFYIYSLEHRGKTRQDGRFPGRSIFPIRL